MVTTVKHKIYIILVITYRFCVLDAFFLSLIVQVLMCLSLRFHVYCKTRTMAPYYRIVIVKAHGAHSCPKDIVFVLFLI